VSRHLCVLPSEAHLLPAPCALRPFPHPNPSACLSPIFLLVESAEHLRNLLGEIAEKPAPTSCGEAAENLRNPRGEAVETLADNLCESGGELADNSRIGRGAVVD